MKQSKSHYRVRYKEKKNSKLKEEGGIVTVKRSKSRRRLIWRFFLGLMRGHFAAGFFVALSFVSPIFLFLVGLSVITWPPTFLSLYSVYVYLFGLISVQFMVRNFWTSFVGPVLFPPNDFAFSTSNFLCIFCFSAGFETKTLSIGIKYRWWDNTKYKSIKNPKFTQLQTLQM